MAADGNEGLTRPTEFEFMAIDEWNAFNRQLRMCAQKSGVDVESLGPGELVLVDGRRLGVMNLAQLCHISGPDKWVELIDNHLSSLAAHVGGIPEPFSMLDLRVQLLPDDQADREVLRRFGARPFAEGVVESLTVRLADSVRPVPTSEIEQLGWDLEDAWADAWAQTRTLERPEEVSFVDVSGAEIIHLFSEHSFGASFLPYLDDVLDGMGDHGAIVSIPVRHSVLVHPIFDMSVLTAVQAMIPITRQVNRTGPGAVSAHLYWWRRDSMMWIPTYFAADGMEFYPPNELASVIDALNRAG
jgi:hypothetical protein